MNFDDRSFETNDEITASFIDEATALRFDAIFDQMYYLLNELL